MSGTIIITGGASGLGLALATAFLERGDRVMIADLAPADERPVSIPSDARYLRLDVRSEDEWTAARAEIDESWGGLDVLVNNAGVAAGGMFADLSLEDWDWQLSINLMGVIKGCKAFLPLLRASQGKIINIASMAALMQGPAMSNYNVAKAGVVALSESLLIELKPEGVAVHVVCPSFFQTNLLDSFRGPTPEMKQQVGKLLEGSPISAADIAGYIYDEVAKGEFMILPHEQGRVAWAIKRQNPQIIYDEMTVMCEKMRAKLGAS